MKSLNSENLLEFFDGQLNDWPLAGKNFSLLDQSKYRSVEAWGFTVQLQCNPARIISTAAKVDAKTISERKCFLCDQNRPPEQNHLEFNAASGNEYVVLVNPYPILNRHCTITAREHVQQAIAGRFEDMIEIAELLPDYAVAYNGPKCGATAPDHHHFQIGLKDILPIVQGTDTISRDRLFSSKQTKIFALTEYIKGAILIQSTSAEDCAGYFYQILDLIGCPEGEYEPMVNILVWKDGSYIKVFLVARRSHRPSVYMRKGRKQILISPGAIDLAGLFVTPVVKDFTKVNQEILQSIISDVCIGHKEADALANLITDNFVKYQPKVSVGVQFEKVLNIRFISTYTIQNDVIDKEEAVISYKEGKIEWNGKLYDELYFEPVNYSSSLFELKDVTIGGSFHWERKEDQKFKGGLVIIVEKEKLTAINMVGVEDYLVSVISSEMSATSSKEFLKAHAVISRSWLLFQMYKNDNSPVENPDRSHRGFIDSRELKIKWYDKEDHASFDVCSSDHCQRYQGVSWASTKAVIDAVNDTWGEVLCYKGKICDARFSKCCGGMTEEFETCWEDVPHPYLPVLRDNGDGSDFHDLTVESKAEKWILSSPKSFCNTADSLILKQVLNNYDLETPDFYRWKVVYTQEEISALISKRIASDFGEILDISPVKRGPSGRISLLRIVGMNRSIEIGKELEIRKVLSESHLYSSAFVVKKEGVWPSSDEVEIPARFILYGAGWGHGVGLCQIGAAVMGEKGYSYDDILLHYYKGAQIERRY